MKAVRLKVGVVGSWTLATIFIREFRKLLIGRDQPEL
jgi:hypothetical protein